MDQTTTTQARLAALGITPEELDRYAHERELARRRERYHTQPARMKIQRIRTCRNFLMKCGYAVLLLPALPWTDEDREALMLNLEAAAAAAAAGGADE